MRYSEYFVKVPELYPVDASTAEQLLREAERIASQHIPYHLILCAKSWLEVFKSPDNAMRCLLEAECRTNDCRGFIEIADWQLKLLGNKTIAGRCLKKAANIANSEEDFMRLEEVFIALQFDEMAAYCRSKYHKTPIITMSVMIVNHGSESLRYLCRESLFYSLESDNKLRMF